MKRRDLMIKLAKIAKQKNLHLEIKEGGNHTKIKVGEKQTVVGRHTEINNLTAKSIIKTIEQAKGETK